MESAGLASNLLQLHEARRLRTCPVPLSLH